MKFPFGTYTDKAFLPAVGFLLAVLCSCAAPEKDNRTSGKDSLSSSAAMAHPVPKRVMLVSVQALDSAEAAAPVVVDRMLKQVFDSIAGTEYVEMSKRDEVPGAKGDSGISVGKLAENLHLDGIIALRVARFGSVVGVDMSVFDPVGQKPIFHDRAFSFIRYRDKEDNKLFGPALYEALDRLVNRLARRPDSDYLIVSAEPIIISNVVIDRDSALGKIATSREKISTDGIRALGDFMRLKYPELIVFDFESRARVYETVGVMLVEDYESVNNLERDAMFKLGLSYYLTTGITPVAGDSVEIRAEVRYILSPRSDSLVDSESRRYPLRQFESSTVVKDVLTEILEISSALLGRHSDRIREQYQSSITPGR